MTRNRALAIRWLTRAMRGENPESAASMLHTASRRFAANVRDACVGIVRTDPANYPWEDRMLAHLDKYESLKK
jgi:hypothetical protein